MVVPASPGAVPLQRQRGKMQKQEQKYLIVLNKIKKYIFDRRKIDVHGPQMRTTHQIQRSLGEVLVERSHSLQRI